MNKEKLEELATRAANKAFKNRRTSDDSLFEDDDAIEENVENINIDEITEFDIFDHCDREFVQKGDYVDYMIKKNGAIAGNKKHPYSWEKLQKEYGEGRYQVIAKSKATGRIVKKQSMEVDSLPSGEKDSSEGGFNPNELVTRLAEIIKPQKKEGPDFTEIMAMMDRAADKARNEAQSQNQTLIQMMQENTKMMMLMFTSQNQNTKKDSSSDVFNLFQTFAEKMENRFERVIDKLQNNQPVKNEVGVMEMLKLKEEAEDRGFKRYAQLNQLAEAKAQEKVELIEEYRGEGGEKKDKSMTETLIETMLPTIAGALAQSKAAPIAPAKAAIPQPRGPVSRPHNPRAAKASAPTLPKANFKPQAKPNPANSKSIGQAPRQNLKPTSQVNNGLPKANFNPPKPTPKPVVEVQAVDEAWKKQATDLLLPVFTEHLLNQSEPVNVAPIIVATLNQNGISREEFLNKVGISDILDIVKAFELPEIAYPWFEEVYANIKDGTNIDVGEHSTNV